MSPGDISYNPNFLVKENPNWFTKFIRLQDEVPSELLKKPEDTIFLKYQIIQFKAIEPETVSPSIIASHLLQPSDLTPKEKQIQNHGWITGIIALCFIFYAIANFGYYRRIRQIIKSFFASRLFSQLSRDGGILSERGSLFLFLSFLLGFSLFLYKLLAFYYSVPIAFWQSFVLYLEIIAGVIIFYLIKLGLYNLTGILFNTKKEVSDYILNVYISGQFAGIILLPIIVFVTYIQNEYIIYGGIISLLILYMYSVLRGVVMTVSKVKISLYYIFLYLCTLEILPLVLLAKVLSKMLI